MLVFIVKRRDEVQESRGSEPEIEVGVNRSWGRLSSQLDQSHELGTAGAAARQLSL